jgi:hypothetical protein
MTARRIILFLAAVFLLTCCAPPSDEAWFRIVGFGNTTTTTTTTTTEGDEKVTTTTTKEHISVLDSDLHDGGTDSVDVFLENYATVVGTDEGRSVHVYRAEVEYLFGAYSLPDFVYGVTLALPPPGTDGNGSGTLKNLPLAPAALKGWLLLNLPAEITEGAFQIEAQVTLRARSEEGTELETSGGLAIIF